MNKKRLPLFVLALGILAFIGGCAPTPTQDTVRVPVFTGVEVQDISALQQAQAMLESAPVSANPDQRIFEAAMLFASAGDLAKSAEAAKLVVAEQLSDSQYIEFNLFVAELELSLGNPQGAADRLTQDRFVGISATFNASLRARPRTSPRSCPPPVLSRSPLVPRRPERRRSIAWQRERERERRVNKRERGREKGIA